MPTASPCMKPKKVSTAPAAAKAEALTNSRSMMKAADRAEHQAGQDRAAAQHLEPVIEHADLAELVEADRRRVGAGGAERVVDQQLAPGREVRRQRQHDRRRVAFGVSWNACAPISMPM